MDKAREGDVETAARCELALLGIRHPTPEQMAGAALRAWHREDTRILAFGKNWQEGGGLPGLIADGKWEE